MAVVNNLESYSTTDSLSANMGRELNEIALDHEERIVTLESSIPTITVGTTTTGDTASVTNSGTATDIVLDFTIPSGGSTNSCVTKVW
jgi:hypothetical protein